MSRNQSLVLKNEKVQPNSWYTRLSRASTDVWVSKHWNITDSCQLHVYSLLHRSLPLHHTRFGNLDP